MPNRPYPTGDDQHANGSAFNTMGSIDRTQATQDSPEPVADADVCVLGGGPLGAAVARRLQTSGRAVVLLDESIDDDDLSVIRIDPTDAAALNGAALKRDAVVVVATPSDRRNLLAAQLVRAHFDVERIVVLTNHPDRVEAMADVGHDVVCATELLADGLVAHL